MTNGPFEMRHDEGGYVEFLNEDVPTVVREIDGRVAILTTLEQPRKVVGYRVYDPGSSPSEVFGSASPAGVVKPWRLDKALAGYETVMDGNHEAILRFASEDEFLFFIEAISKGRIMSAIEPAGVGVETVPPSSHVLVPYDLRLKIGKALDQIVCDDSTPEQVDKFIETFREFGLTITEDQDNG